MKECDINGKQVGELLDFLLETVMVSPEKNRSELVTVSLSIGEEQPTEPSTEPPTVVPTNPTEGETIIMGDVDGDGVVTIIDATYIQRKLASIPILFELNETVADTDEDGSVTIIDATYIQRWLANLPSNDNIGKPIK